MPKMDRRRRHDFRKFREQLEQLSSEEIRERLNANRIRSTQRRAVAEQLLRERAERPEDETVRAAAAEATNLARSARRAARSGRAGGPGEDARAARPGRGSGAFAARAPSAGPAASGGAGARRVRRPAIEEACALLGAIAILGSFLAAVAALLRR